MTSDDQRVRLAAFNFLDQHTQQHGEVLSRDVLSAGFLFGVRRVPLLGPQGIFKPALLEFPLSITSVPQVEGQERPYDDQLGDDGLLRYRYRGTDTRHRDNVGLRQAMTRGVPLVYLHGIVPGRYMPVWPVYIVGDEPAHLTFTVAVEDRRLAYNGVPEPIEADIRRRYVTRVTLQRLHQQAFRERVLRAYQEHCAICRLRHQELLEAAHILPDGHPLGQPTIPNGLALCKLHHAAFDADIIGISADYIVQVRPDILDETDGPMLRHGLQALQAQQIWVPRPESLKPNRAFLEERFARFRRAS